MASNGRARRGQQVRLHSGHSHGHHHDTTYLVSRNKQDAGVRITRIGLYVNLGMAIGKGIGGYVFHSQALSADAVHSLTDLLSDFMTLATVSWALKPPNEKFPFGYGKMESLGSVGVSGLLLVGGLLMGWSALIDLLQIYTPNLVNDLEWLGIVGCGHSHGHEHTIPNIQAAWLAAGSVVVKEWLYRATMKVARSRNSAVLASNAVHHRVDSLTALAALISIAASNIFPSLVALDAIAALVISSMVIRAGTTNVWTSLTELADQAIVNESQKAPVKKAAEEAISSIEIHGEKAQFEISNITGIKSGQNYIWEIKIVAPDNATVLQLGEWEEEIRLYVAEKVRGTRMVRIRWAADSSSGKSEVFAEWIPEKPGTESMPVENGHANGSAHTHDHGHEHEHLDESKDKKA